MIRTAIVAVVIAFLVVFGFLEFFEISLKSLRLRLRKGDLSRHIRGTIAFIVAALIGLLGFLD